MIHFFQNHVPLVATMVPGELIARKGDDEYFLHVAGGFLEIREGNSIIALADAAEHHYEIDVAAAEAAKAQAEQGMREQKEKGLYLALKNLMISMSLIIRVDMFPENVKLRH
jgi:F0F1-type ATP synthase epsilon subunit